MDRTTIDEKVTTMTNPLSHDELTTIIQRWEKAYTGPYFVSEDESVWELYAENTIMSSLPRQSFSFSGHPLKIAKIIKDSGNHHAEYWPDDATSVALAHSWQDINTLLGSLRHYAPHLFTPPAED